MRQFLIGALALSLIITALPQVSVADDTKPAKELFGAMALPTKGQASSFGFYAKGCLSGGIAIAADGPTWQAIHLSRNRRWGHPEMIGVLERLSREAAAQDSWPGLLLGDISQPRGGPMLTGHSSHQIGLDADIWLTPMPAKRLNPAERENVAQYSMLRKGQLRVDPNRWTPAHARLIMRAASYPTVERIFVHPGIKKKLCDSWTGDRRNLGKVRPYYGHHYHFHIRIHCPDDAVGCQKQIPVGVGDGCGAELAYWLSDKPWGKPGPKPARPVKPVKPRFIKLSELPKACIAVLNAPSRQGERLATPGTETIAAPAQAGAVASPQVAGNAGGSLPRIVPVPRARPLD